jgi:hypothetical protein
MSAVASGAAAAATHLPRSLGNAEQLVLSGVGSVVADGHFLLLRQHSALQASGSKHSKIGVSLDGSVRRGAENAHG